MQPMKKRRRNRLFSLVLALSMVITMFVPLTASAESPLGNFSGDYSIEGDAVIANIVNGNNYVISDTYAETFIFEADLSFLEGGTGGLLFNAKSPTDPGADWCALHIGSGSVRLFCEGNYADTENGLNEIVGIPSGAAEPYELRLEVTQTAIIVSVDGTEVINKAYSGLEGGYVGFTTYSSKARFENIQFTDTTPPPSEALGELSGNYFTIDHDGVVTIIEVPAEVYVGDSASFEVTFINRGKTPVYNASAEITGNLAQPGQRQFIGNVASGTEDSVDFLLSANEGGPITGEVIITYEDANMNVKELREPFSANAIAMEVPEFDPNMVPDDIPMEEPPAWYEQVPVWGWVGGGVVVLILLSFISKLIRAHKEKKLLEDDDEDF